VDTPTVLPHCSVLWRARSTFHSFVACARMEVISRKWPNVSDCTHDELVSLLSVLNIGQYPPAVVRLLNILPSSCFLAYTQFRRPIRANFTMSMLIAVVFVACGIFQILLRKSSFDQGWLFRFSTRSRRQSKLNNYRYMTY
jgi:hypothetical protein